MEHKLYKAKWKYHLHDDIGCIREFKTKEAALQWKATRQELKLKIIKPAKPKPDFSAEFEALF